MMKLGEEYTKLIGNLQDNRTISGFSVGLQWVYSGSTVALQWVYSGSRTNKRRTMDKSKLKLKDR
ncbi:hypothetical protein [Capnocytophaga ochracea]|uniref:hypothetical protein n=1 Tax=Capnocytophaga ochracea TaxID=1018 RepID=UPI0015F10A84|nr:hypothetical protein [Capnocytophaga ochracea]